MKMRDSCFVAVMAVFLFPLIATSDLYAEDDSSQGIDVMIRPGAFANVNGHVETFRTHHWMNDGYSEGVVDFSLERALSEGLDMEFEGSVTPEENDIAVDLSLDKKDVGFLKVNYDTFRKYYDGTGGVYYPFTQSEVTNLSQDLKMDIGSLFVEFGPHISDTTDLSILYERHTKDGSKSRLTWAIMKEGATSRNIAPSWQDLDEVTDVVGLKGKTDFCGFTVSGEQRAEFVSISSTREERNLSSTSTTASDKKVRYQVQTPEADLWTTLVRGEKWILNDKAYFSLGYNYQKLNTSEVENIHEYDEYGVPRSFSSPKNKDNAKAENDYDSHSWVTNFSSFPMDHLSFLSKVKTSVVSRRGSSTYPGDTTDPPDGIANTTDSSAVKNAIYNVGEDFTLRYSGIAKTSIYTGVELEQGRDWINEYRISLAGQSGSEAAENFSRETLTHVQKTAWTMGGRVVPNQYLNFTAQARKSTNNSDYDDIVEGTYSSGALSSFIDSLRIESTEFTTKGTWKPLGWLQTSLRYQLLDKAYFMRPESQAFVKSVSYSNVYSYDLIIQPVEKFLFDFSLSKQDFKMETPASQVTSGYLPSFNGDVNSVLLSSSYIPKQNLSYTGSILYSKTDNFDDYTSVGLPLGPASDRVDLTFDMKWNPKEDITIQPRYAFYWYDGNSSVDVGDYNAHVIWLDLGLKW